MTTNVPNTNATSAMAKMAVAAVENSGIVWVLLVGTKYACHAQPVAVTL